MYIIAVNCVGEIGGMIYSGDSCVINPEGKILMELSGYESILEYELFDDVLEFRSAFQVKNDRQEELYCKFINNLHIETGFVTSTKI